MALLICLLSAALWTVMTRSLIRSAIGLALTSAVLTVLMFKLHAQLAAVFELSVCTGLISVLFISTISLTQPLKQEEIVPQMRERLRRFWYLPVIIIAMGIFLSLMRVNTNLTLPPPATEKDARFILWNQRQVDMLGQIIILLTGVFGVVVLFKEARRK